MNNSDYWEKRFNILNENLLKNGENSIAKMKKAYNIAADNIQKEIESFYKQFAVDNNLSFSDTKKLLTSSERKLFQMQLKDYISIGEKKNLSKKWIKKLKNVSLTYKIDRLTALKIQMQQDIELLQAQKALDINKTLNKTYEDGYYKTIFEVQRGLGVGSAFLILNANTVNNVLAKPWTPDGKNFSAKIWGNDRTNLLYQLDTTLTQGIIRGIGQQQIINEIRKILNKSKSAISRLVMTESAFFSSASRIDGYKQLKIKKFKYLATLDSKTSSICIDMNGKIFNLEDYQIGINAPPLHPWCRSNTVPYFDDEFTEDLQKAASDENNNTYSVPSDTTYKQWHDTHVKNNPEAFFEKVKKLLSNDEIDENELINEFNKNLKNVKNKKVRKLLKKAIKEVKIEYDINGKNAYYDGKNKIVFNSKATPRTVAHELFHYIDDKYKITTRDTFKNAIEADKKALIKRAKDKSELLPKPLSIGEMISAEYPDMFNKDLTCKEEYAGLSDIISGMTKDKENFGYGHNILYWYTPGALESETWANFGSMFYGNNPAVMETTKELLGNTFNEIESILKELK